MGISDDDSDEGVHELMQSPHWEPPSSAIPTYTAEELIQRVQSALEKKFGFDGARKAFLACGEEVERNPSSCSARAQLVLIGMVAGREDYKAAV